MMRQASS